MRSIDEVRSILQTEVLVKEGHLKQQGWGIFGKMGATKFYHAAGPCQCVLGCYLMGKPVISDSLSYYLDSATYLQVEVIHVLCIVAGFDDYPDWNDALEGNPWRSLGFELAEWSDEMGILEIKGEDE